MLITNLYNFMRSRKGKKFELISYRIIKLSLNLFYPILIKLIPRPEILKERDDIIISLTSFPGRINSVWLTIETLIRQTYRPYKIVLWLADSQFKSINDLPSTLLKLREKGLDIKFCDDLRSHKKYYYTMLEYPNYTIITVDDDTFYPENLVENLVITSDANPGVICCNLAHLMTINDGKIDSYESWLSGAEGFQGPSDFLVPIGCEGVLYPPNSLSKEAFDIIKIKEICPLADDLWLKAMATLNGIKAVKTNKTSITYVNQISSRVQSLNEINVNQNMNDIQLNKIISNYPRLKKIWRIDGED